MFVLIPVFKTICVETIAILDSKQINSNSFKNKIANKLFTPKW